MTIKRFALMALAPLSLTVCLLSRPAQERPSLSNPAPQNPPSLGPAPSLNGPRNSTIVDAHKLLSIRTIYVEPIDNRLNQSLTEDLSKEGPFQVVSDRAKADAVLRGTCFDSRHMKDVHTEVFLTGPGGKSVWQDIVRTPYSPPPLAKAVSNTATLIVLHLKQSLQEARRR